MMHKILIIGLLACCAGSVNAQQEDPAAPPPLPPIDAQPRTSVTQPGDVAEAEQPADGDVPVPPKVVDESELLEPTVEISRDDDDNIIEEYRFEGRVYMVKVTPKHGVPYYYMDDDGDGTLELSDADSVRNPVKPAMWKIKEW